MTKYGWAILITGLGGISCIVAVLLTVIIKLALDGHLALFVLMLGVALCFTTAMIVLIPKGIEILKDEFNE